MAETTPSEANEHICASHAICFECFRRGADRTRSRREAWAQRSLPFEARPQPPGPRELAHRRRMLEHLSRSAQRA